MPKKTFRTCRECGRHSSEVGDLSHTRLCVDCSSILRNENILGLIYKSGEPWLRWRRAMAATVGGVLLDDPRSRT